MLSKYQEYIMGWFGLFETVLSLQTIFTLTYAQCNDTADVVVVGAGLAGLSAAQNLIDAGKKVVVLEARDRVGGRVGNFNISNGGVVEIGAAFVGPTQDYVLTLAEELSVQLFSEFVAGNTVFFTHGQATHFSSGNAIPPLDDASALQLGNLINELDTMAQSIDVNTPWTNQNASLWDSMTFSTFLSIITTSKAAADIVETATAAVFSAQSSELSLLYVLAYVAAAGNETTPGTFERLIGGTGAAQESRIIGGTGLLPLGLANKIGNENIVLNAPVRSIIGDASGYTVSSLNYSVQAQHVVVAMSPPMAARIYYDPPLPAQRD